MSSSNARLAAETTQDYLEGRAKGCRRDPRPVRWDLTVEPFYRLLRATNPVVNVYKHGKGTSLDALNAKYPAYVRSPLGDLTPSWAEDLVSYEWVKVSDEDFAAPTGALRELWAAFPERLYAIAY